MADALDYLLTVASLRILDALAGPDPEAPADQRRERDRERRGDGLTAELSVPP